MSVTIEFAGISTLVWHREKQEAEVVLVDLEAHGFHRHHATLAMTGGTGIVTPDPDISLAVPGRPIELAVWNLKGTEIEIGCDPEPLNVQDEPINATEPPPANAESIRWLPEIGELCGSRELARDVKVAARIRIKSGRITSTLARHELVRAQFSDEGRALAPVRYFLPRFLVELPGKRVTLRLDRKRTLEFQTDHTLVISNTCVCEPTFKGGAGHFYGHYRVVQRKREPIIRSFRGAGPSGLKTFAWPAAPEECFCAYLMI